MKHDDRYSWEVLMLEYVAGTPNSKGIRVYPSTKELSEKYGIPIGTIAGQCAKHKWLEQRHKHQQELAEDAQKAIAKVTGTTLASQCMEALTVYRAILLYGLEKMKKGELHISASTVADMESRIMWALTMLTTGGDITTLDNIQTLLASAVNVVRMSGDKDQAKALQGLLETGQNLIVDRDIETRVDELMGQLPGGRR